MEDMVIWSGPVPRVSDGRDLMYRVRVLDASAPDAIVEYQDGGTWEAEENDAKCAEIYMLAMFSFRRRTVRYQKANLCYRDAIQFVTRVR